MNSGITLRMLLALGFTAAVSQSLEVDRTLPVSGPVQLDVTSNANSFEIKGNKHTSSVRVHAVIRPLYRALDFGIAKANIAELERNPPVEQSGNHIRIGYIREELLKNVSIHFDVQVPRETEVQAQTSSGAIRIDGIAGPARIQTSSGQSDISNIGGAVLVESRSAGIILRRIRGRVSVRSHSGGIRIVDIEGPVEAQTTSGRTEISDVKGELRSITHSGSISVDNVRGSVITANTSGSIDAFQIAGPVQAHTQSGAVRIAQISPASIRAQSHSGAITVDLAGEQGYSIDAQSHSGKVVGPRKAELRRSANLHQLRQEIGGGGPLVDLDTHSSKIEIN